MFGKKIIIEKNTYSIKKLIAEGATATVHVVTNTKTKKLFALKRMNTLGDAEVLAAIALELNVLLQISEVAHPNLIKLAGHEIMDNTQLMLFPLYLQTLDTFRAPSDDAVANIFGGILSGLHFFQTHFSKRHNDMKPLNVLISKENFPVITDFGSVSEIDSLVSTRKDALVLMDFHSRMTTPNYRAPELWEVQKGVRIEGAKTDAFSCGALLFFLLYGKPAFDFNVGKVILPQSTRSNQLLVEILLSMLIVEVDCRMNVVEALEAHQSGRISNEQEDRNSRHYHLQKKKKQQQQQQHERETDFVANFESEPQENAQAQAQPGSFNKKSAVHVLRFRRNHFFVKKLIKKRVWLALSDTRLTIAKSTLPTGKFHLELNLATASIVDVAVNPKDDNPSFFLCFSDPNARSGGTKLEIFVDTSEEALDWSLKIASNFESTRTN